MFSVYILHSQKTDRFYIGQTDNLSNRFDQHNSPENPNSTKKGQPWVLYLSIDCQSRLQALRIERYIKKMKSRKYIETLKAFPEKVEAVKRAHDC